MKRKIWFHLGPSRVLLLILSYNHQNRTQINTVVATQIKVDWVGVEPTTSAMLKFYPESEKPMTHHDDAVKVAPDSYKVVLENDQVRVLEVRIKQGAKSEMHSHPKSVAICLNDQRLKFTFPNGKTEDTDLKRGQAVWLDGLSHAVENVGTEDVSSVVVELKK
jgi:beta-alanine degradation protein BauB